MLKLEKNSILPNSHRTSKSAEIYFVFWIFCILQFAQKGHVAVTHKRSLFCVITWNDIKKPLTQCVNVIYIDSDTEVIPVAVTYLLPPWIKHSTIGKLGIYHSVNLGTDPP